MRGRGSPPTERGRRLSSTDATVTSADVERAAAAIEGAVVRTPAPLSQTLSDITGADVVVKFENLQFTASYKERGALYRLLTLGDEAVERGVVTMSAGNFAQGVAHHAARLGVGATIVMPAGTPSMKVSRTTALGAEVVLHGATLDESRAHADRLAGERGSVLLSPFDDPAVIAGQGTVAVELLDEHPDLGCVVVPVGGGGLLAGMSLAMRDRAPHVEVVGVQSERYPSMVNALRGTNLPCGGFTIAEGIAVTEAGRLTSAILTELAVDVVTVTEDHLEEAVVLYLEIEKVVAEGAGAAPLAALLEHADRFRGRRVGIVLSGGNIDLRLLASVIMRGMVRTGRLSTLRVDLPDEAGALGRLTTLIGEGGANIVEVRHVRNELAVHSRSAGVEVSVETPDAGRLRDLVSRLQEAGYEVTPHVPL